MKTKILLLLFLIFFSININAATLYMSTVGTDSGNCTVSACLTLQYTMNQQASGDTIIISNGIYRGTANQIDASHYPENGPGTGIGDNRFTIIKAENDGDVLFDGEDARSMFYLPSTVRSYLKFEGIIWGRSGDNENVAIGGVIGTHSDHIYFSKCGFFDSGSSVLASNSHTGLWIRYTDYTLVEDCYVWGELYYGIILQENIYGILRRCVGRFDIHRGQRGGVFGIYTSDYCEIQNCITIDNDHVSTYDNTGDGFYGIAWPTTDGPSTHLIMRGCIVLNINAAAEEGNAFLASVNNGGCSDCGFYDSVFYDSSGGFWDRGASSNNIYNCIFSSKGETAQNFGLCTASTFIDSIIFNNGVTGACNYGTSNYNDYYNNGTDGHTYGDNDYYSGTAIAPLTNGLSYLIKIENNSLLKTSGSNGNQIGPQIIYQIGGTGIFYNETGYATTTAIKLWPFPNEHLVRAKMAAYTGNPNGSVTGARGFTTTSLTGYILNYLEPTNTITVTSNVTSTDDVNEYIYGESGETDEVDPIVAISDSDPKTLSSGYTTTLGFTSSDANGIDECKWRSGSAPDESNGTLCTGTTSGTCSVTGLVQGNNSIYIGCADPTNNWGSDSITVNAPSYRAQAGGSFNIR